MRFRSGPGENPKARFCPRLAHYTAKPDINQKADSSLQHQLMLKPSGGSEKERGERERREEREREKGRKK